MPRAPRSTRTAPIPRIVLDLIGEVVHDWDIVSDRLTWGPNAAKVLAGLRRTSSVAGRAYGELFAPTAPGPLSTIQARPTPATASLSRALWPDGAGSRRSQQEAIWVEDSGRWFAGDGEAERAHGIVRVITNHYEAERELSSVALRSLDRLLQPRPSRRDRLAHAGAPAGQAAAFLHPAGQPR